MLAALFVSTLLFATPRPAVASSIAPMDLDALSVGAERILIGTVEKVESHFISPKNRYIVTDATIVVERNVLGVTAGERFVVRHLGGEVGKVGQRVVGEASYRPGERVLLFAVARQGSYFALGMGQGVLHLDGKKLDDVVERVRAIVYARTRGGK
jgi:hypothetical protein